VTEGFKTIKIDPRDFIGEPYQDCPNCGQHEFGVLSVHDETYTRRCRSCWHTITLVLPKLRKKVIYIDQFVISNIMKMLNAEAPGHERAKSEPLWGELFELLGVLCKMQLVICPNSTEHDDESLISQFYEELKYTYEHFSAGISFDRATSIEEHQIVDALKCWLKNEKPKFDFDPRTITHQNLHGWHDRFFVTTTGTLPGHKQVLQKSRSSAHGGLRELFKRWQVEKKGFDEVFELEKNWFANFILRGIEEDRQRTATMQSLLESLGPLPRSIAQYSRTMNTPVMHGLQWVAKMHLIDREQPKHEYELDRLDGKAQELVIEFVKSGAISETPSNIIAASMYAALSRKAAAGQQRTPDEGMTTDIRIVSALLPYCDAMFIDNFCLSLLREIPQSRKLPYTYLAFSSKTSREFLSFLRNVRDSVSGEHVQLLHEVYGPKAIQPPKSIYGIGIRKPK
jgi:hypothetical protein